MKVSSTENQFIKAIRSEVLLSKPDGGLCVRHTAVPKVFAI